MGKKGFCSDVLSQISLIKMGLRAWHGRFLRDFIHVIFQTRILQWVAISFSRGSPDPGIEPASPALAGGFFTTEPLGKPPSSS